MPLKSGSYVMVNGERVLRHKTQPAGAAKPERPSRRELNAKRPPGISPSVGQNYPKRHKAGVDSNATEAGSE